eukprot:Nk52_evm37s32 gene=Nk52_evmTU37s32
MLSYPEKLALGCVVILSNSTFIPVIITLAKKRFFFECFVACFALVCSVMYHTSEAYGAPLMMDEGKWHKLDNVAAISGFVVMFIHFMDFQDRGTTLILNYISFGIILILQECSPWDLRFTVYPIVISAVCFIVRYSYFHRTPFDVMNLNRGLFIGCIAIFFFYLGLDDRNDYLRIYHGLWHFFIGAAGYFMWQSVHPVTRGVIYDK